MISHILDFEYENRKEYERKKKNAIVQCFSASQPHFAMFSFEFKFF